ncbi:MAG TPA: purine-nucleoside phosphorylase, partial [Candidatus Aminicenantes bacterium]|nr:purine-nucleoside phosphorylase [Candidatus Aminicenantes bacterium]
MELLERLNEAVKVVAPVVGAPRVGLVLGSGLGAFADRLENPRPISYTDIPHFRAVTVAGHAGRLVGGTVGGVPVAVLQGRYHYYEGHPIEDVAFPVRLLCRLGVDIVVLTNAAGGINRQFAPGDLMIIRDHLNLMGTTPLRGGNDERIGPRFPDMSDV